MANNSEMWVNILGWWESIVDWLECIEDYHHRMGTLESSLERWVNISGMMVSRKVTLVSSGVSWVSNSDWLGNRMVWQEYSWGMLANSLESSENTKERLEDMMDWMGSKMGW